MSKPIDIIRDAYSAYRKGYHIVVDVVGYAWIGTNENGDPDYRWIGHSGEWTGTVQELEDAVLFAYEV